jgi:hypothetical protein
MSLINKIDLTKRGEIIIIILMRIILIYKMMERKYQCAGSFFSKKKKKLPGSNSENSLGRPLSREQSQSMAETTPVHTKIAQSRLRSQEVEIEPVRQGIFHERAHDAYLIACRLIQSE